MFSFIDIQNYQQKLLAGTQTCREAVLFYLDKIDQNKNLNAFISTYKDEALKRADELDEQRNIGVEMGPLHGVVVALKDVISYEGQTLTAGSRILENYKSLYNSTVVQLLLDAEAIIIGNCNCDEFAMGSSNENSVYGPVFNALDVGKVPGGSSGGSAVAVQASLCMVSLGTDTGGSVRQPAAFCGIVGLKPSYGRISRWGIVAYASSFDQVGIFGNNVEDVALVLETISHPDIYDSTMLQTPPPENILDNKETKKYKFYYLDATLEHEGLDDEIRTKTSEFFDQLQADGHTVEKISFDYLPYIVPAYYVLTTAEASSNLSRYDGVRYGYLSKENLSGPDDLYKKTRSEGFGAEVKKRIMLGSFVLSTGYYDAYFAKAQKIRRLLVDKVSEIFSDYHAILMPVTPTTAYPLHQKDKDPMSMYIGDIYTVFANLTGLPGISLPLFSHGNNMPFGLQVLTKKEDEVTLLQISDTLMRDYKLVDAEEV